MKKKLNVIKYILFAIAVMAVFAGMSQYYYLGLSVVLGVTIERACYCVMALITSCVFFDICKNENVFWIKLILSYTTAVLFTTVVYLFNNFWRYVYLRFACGINEGLSFCDVLTDDLAYTYSYGEYRYPLVFFGMIAVFIVILIFTEFNSVNKLESLFYKAERAIYRFFLLREDLEELYIDTIFNPNEVKFVRYIDSMPKNEKGKEKLINLVEAYPTFTNVRDLLIFFGNTLTKEEYEKYRQMYFESMEIYISRNVEYYESIRDRTVVILGELDSKFGISD